MYMYVHTYMQYLYLQCMKISTIVSEVLCSFYNSILIKVHDSSFSISLLHTCTQSCLCLHSSATCTVVCVVTFGNSQQFYWQIILCSPLIWRSFILEIGDLRSKSPLLKLPIINAHAHSNARVHQIAKLRTAKYIF